MSKHAPRGAWRYKEHSKTQYIAHSHVKHLHPPLHMKDRGEEMKAQEESDGIEGGKTPVGEEEGGGVL